MKHHRQALLLAMFSLMPFAKAGHQANTSVPTLAVSCTCVAGDPVVFQGSGYKSRSQVEISVQGPSSYVLSLTADANGNVFVDYGTALYFSAGSYTATASQIQGKSVTTVATAGFTID